MTANTSLAKGRDPRYLTEGAGTGHAGGTRYYSEAAGEPPGQWLGAGAPPSSAWTGTWTRTSSRRSTWTAWRRTASVLTRGRRPHFRPVREREDAAVAAHLVAHPYATAGELAEVRAAERAKSQSAIPYFRLHGERGQVGQRPARLATGGRSAAREGGADERRSGAGGPGRARSRTRCWRPLGRPLLGSSALCSCGPGRRARSTGTRPASVAAVFLQHTSREGDPQLHVHIAVMNLAQRGDQADARWRTLHGAMLYQERLAVAAYAARELATRLTDLGYVLVPREDGNGFEVGGVRPGGDGRVLLPAGSDHARGGPDGGGVPAAVRPRTVPAGRCGPWPRRPRWRRGRPRAGAARTGAGSLTGPPGMSWTRGRRAPRSGSWAALSGVHEAVRAFARPEGLDAPAELDASSGRALSG